MFVWEPELTEFLLRNLKGFKRESFNFWVSNFSKTSPQKALVSQTTSGLSFSPQQLHRHLGHRFQHHPSRRAFPDFPTSNHRTLPNYKLYECVLHVWVGSSGRRQKALYHKINLFILSNPVSNCHFNRLWDFNVTRNRPQSLVVWQCERINFPFAGRILVANPTQTA